MRLLVALVAALVLAPAAGAWTRLTTTNVQNIVKPSVLVTSSHSELIAYDDPAANAIRLIRGGKTQTVVSGYLSVAEPQLLQQPSGRLLLYFGGTTPGSTLQGLLHVESSDGGATWSAPAKIKGSRIGDVQGAAMRPDGTPIVSQDGTGFVNVYQGLNGEVTHNVFPYCCGYGESLAVDSTGLAQIALWSNASSPRTGYVYSTLDGSGAAGSWLDLSGGSQTVSRQDRVPLVADRRGNTFTAWSSGYPTSKVLNVQTFRNGKSVRAPVPAWHGFSGGDPKMALAVDSRDRLWAVWSAGGAVRGVHSCSAGASFGPVVHAALPRSGSSVYQLEAAAAGPGVDAVVNAGGALWKTQLLPGLGVRATTTTARVLDDTCPVGGAALAARGKIVHTNAQGKAPLHAFGRHVLVRVTRAGYTPTSFRTP